MCATNNWAGWKCNTRTEIWMANSLKSMLTKSPATAHCFLQTWYFHSKWEKRPAPQTNKLFFFEGSLQVQLMRVMFTSFTSTRIYKVCTHVYTWPGGNRRVNLRIGSSRTWGTWAWSSWQCGSSRRVLAWRRKSLEACRGWPIRMCGAFLV